MLILLNSAAFGLCLVGNSLVRIDNATLFKYGAIYPGVMAKQEYWRFLAAPFLHANALHLLLNMICIGAWSGILEKRVGATYFLVIYLAAAIGGGVVSLYGHTGPFLSVGASGAISGIVGALLCLTILGKLALSPQFFVVTIGINILLATKAAHVDWMAHLGGFTAGFAACAILDGIETINRLWLTCKFPEFAKFNIAIVALCGCLLLLSDPSAILSRDGYFVLAAFAGAIVLLIKGIDLVLGQAKGLAATILVFAALNALLPILAVQAALSTLTAVCRQAGSTTAIAIGHDASFYVDAGCRNISSAAIALGALCFVVTLFILQAELSRGLRDVGFVSSTFRAERNRRQGL